MKPLRLKPSEIIGSHLKLPVVSVSTEEAAAHFGWFVMMASLDCPASSQFTQQQLHWHPSHPGLLEDLESGIYFQ